MPQWRTVTKGLYSVLSAACISMIATEAASACVLRVTTWGGNYQRTYASVVPEFEKQYKCKVEWVIGSTLDFTVKARMGQVDVVTNSQFYSTAGEAEGLWLKLDESKIPNMAKLYSNARRSPYTVWVNVGDYSLAYNSQKIPTPPKSWEALWDPAYKNRVTLFYFGAPATLGLIVMLSEKNGGSIDNVDYGLKKLAELVKSRNLIGMIEVESQLVSLFESGEAWIGPLTTGRLKDLWDKGAHHIKLVRPPEGTFPTITSMNISKSTTNVDMAHNFINFALGVEAQTAFALNNLYAPTNKDVRIPDDFKYKPLLIQGEAFDRLFMMDNAKVNRLQASWRERFDRMVR